MKMMKILPKKTKEVKAKARKKKVLVILMILKR